MSSSQTPTMWEIHTLDDDELTPFESRLQTHPPRTLLTCGPSGSTTAYICKEGGSITNSIAIDDEEETTSRIAIPLSQDNLHNRIRSLVQKRSRTRTDNHLRQNNSHGIRPVASNDHLRRHMAVANRDSAQRFPQVSATGRTRRVSRAMQPRATPVLVQNQATCMTARESLLAAISVGDDVQLKSGYLLRITRISEHADPTQRKLKGWVFRRSLHMEGLVSWVSNSNEVFWMKKLVLGDNSDPDFQGMEQYSIQDVVRQVHLKLTNKPFSGESCPDSLGRFECRMRLTLWFMRAQEKGDIKNSKHGSLMNLTAVSCDSYCGEEDEAIRRLAIGNVAKGGSCSHTIAAEQAHLAKESDLAATAKLLDPSLGNSRQCPINADGEDIVTSTRRIEGATADVIEITEDDVIELEEDDNTSSPQIIDLEKLLLDQTLDKCWNSSGPGRLADAIDAVPYERRYTFGDAFCGAGGMARGAVMAGLRIEWAFDFVQDMCDAYRLNFPTTKIACTSSFEFSVKPYGWQVDILHLSPPCKFFSPAHTIPGRQDEENFAASFGIIEMLKKFKPRIATMEQTLGLAIQAKHKEAFHAILSQFHSAGYSVAWKLMDTSQYGVPQTRKRLIIVASAAGELNPGFPPITHSKNWRENGLKPLQTVRNAIAKIPVDWPHHDVAGELANRIRGKGCDWDAQAGTLTTRGGNTNFHPDGRRFTNRENACLQSFPLEHMFDPKHARNRVIEQIGNAVPPLFAYALLNHIKKALQRADGVVNTNADELASGRDDGRDNGRYDEEMMADMVAQTECVDLTEHEEPTDMLDLTMEG